MDSDNSKNTTTTPSKEYYDDEIDLRELILVLWNYRKLILGIFLASVLIGTVISFAMTPVYQVQAKISLGNYILNPENSKPLMTPETAREILLSSDFQEEAWGSGINAGVLNITHVEKTNILKIILETNDPEQGESLLNKLISHFDKTITEQINMLSESGSLSEKKINSMESMQVLEKPKATSSPVHPNKKLNIAVAGVLGLMVGVFGAFTVDYFRMNPLSFNK